MQPQRIATSTTADAKEQQQLTVEEAKQLETAFKDKDFCKLLSDYVSDISNPKFKEEQEAYLAQLEAQNELPTGKMLIRPSSGFVIKCMHRKKKKREQKIENTGSETSCLPMLSWHYLSLYCLKGASF